ncbi:MAG: peptide-methionine (S)-S-oxide reductase MsrA [Candidatus Margulisbacteria bacterium]|nr:peptide-methionine (S)-S-oxide reductase MsrA [Candidatus Margulisiibacteriota bacterium]
MRLLLCLAFILLVYTPNLGMEKVNKATFAGGCFWCMEHPFDSLEGVLSVTVGYSGGETVNPTYKEVSMGITGHTESVQIIFDPALITYDQLLTVFWQSMDPTDPGGQFNDRGTQYRSAIFYHDASQKEQSISSKVKLNKSGTFKVPIVTEISPFETFYKAEEYHQKYYKKNPIRYKLFRYHSGRDAFLKRTWNK